MRPLSSSAAGSTSSGSTAPASPPTPTSLRLGRRGARLGGARDALPGDVGRVEVDLGGEPRPPEWEVVVSAAHAHRAEGRSRADFLAELVGLRQAIVVGGAHGKTTTTAMIAWALGSRPGSGLDRRRRGAAARRERRSRGRIARRRGRRVRPLDLRAAARDRRRRERRARPPRGLRLGGELTDCFEVAHGRAACRAHVGARARLVPARGAR